MDREEVRRRIETFTPEEMAQLGCSSVEEGVEKVMGMDPEVIRREAAEALLEQEVPLNEVIDQAREFLTEYDDDRLTGLAAFYTQALEDVSGEKMNATHLDADQLFMLLVIAAWRLAEARDRIDTLLDGSRRISAKEEK